jgi:hypothetical protein
MDNENLQKTDSTVNNAQRLRQNIIELTAGVAITEEDSDLREIQKLQKQKLLEDIGVMLVYSSPDQAINSLWDLLKPYLSAGEQLGQKALSRYQEQLSKPLIGQPSEVLKNTGFSQQSHPFKAIIDRLHHTMTPQQHQLLPQVTGRLV